jgi:hypothetical protein
MYINPIHAGTLALAQTLALATRVHARSGDSTPPESPGAAARRHRFKPLQGLAQWWRDLDAADGAAADPAQLMLWAECGGRPYATALTGLLLMQQFRKKRAAGRQGRPVADANGRRG